MRSGKAGRGLCEGDRKPAKGEQTPKPETENPRRERHARDPGFPGLGNATERCMVRGMLFNCS